MARRVVIIGGGFGGLAAASALYSEPVEITLVDRRNHHLFQPLLYQVATAGLAPSDIAEPIRSIFAGQKNLAVRLAEAKQIDLERRVVHLDDGAELAYDNLVVAAGAGPSYFGNDQWSEHAPALKTIGDALDIRQRVLHAFEQAEWTDDQATLDALLTFVVVGAGPTGVELAGAIAEVAFHSLKRDFRRFDVGRAKVILVEGSDAVLPPYPDKLQQSAKRQLESLGVDVRLGSMVDDVDADGVVVNGERIAARTVLWAAGVKGAEVGGTLGVPITRSGQVKVEADLTVPGHPEVFVIGDLAHVEQEDGSAVPGVAQGALQMGTFAGQALVADRKGRPRGTFRYFDKGNMATIGRRRAVMDALGLQLSGFPAWSAWVTVHLFFLVTHRNRLLVFTKWAWAWATYERSSRLMWQGEPGYHGSGASRAARRGSAEP